MTVKVAETLRRLSDATRLLGLYGEGYNRQEKRWKSASGLVIHRDKQSLVFSSLSCCTNPIGPKPRKKPLPARSISP